MTQKGNLSKIQIYTKQVLTFECKLCQTGKWLESIKMSSYEIKFIKANYKNEDDLIKLTDEDLITIGITLIGHRNKIMKGIRSLKEKKKRESITI